MLYFKALFFLIPVIQNVIALKMPPLETSDVLVRAISKDGYVSAKVTDTTNAVAEICELQQCKRLAATALGRCLTSCVLIADGIEKEETFQVRFEGDGPLRGVLGISNGNLQMRGYVGNPQLDLPEASVGTAVGKGQLKIVRLKNLPGEERASPFSSIVAIETGEIAEDINSYVATSEQREGALGAGVAFFDNIEGGAVACSTGWRVELLPGAPDQVAQHLLRNVQAFLGLGLSSTDMRLRGETCEDIALRLLDGMEPEILESDARPTFFCQCSNERVYRTLALLPRDEIRQIIAQNEKIEARCEFCAKLYSMTAVDVANHLDEVDAAAAEERQKPTALKKSNDTR